jgi:hypothetical protein
MSDSYTCEFTEVHRKLATLPPYVYAGGISTPWVAVNDYHRVFVEILVGNIINPLDVSIWQATNPAGAGAKVVTAKALTQMNGGDDGSSCGIELRTEELDVDGGFDCIRVQTLNGGAGGNTYSVVVYGIVGRYLPTGITEWDEVIH